MAVYHTQPVPVLYLLENAGMDVLRVLGFRIAVLGHQQMLRMWARLGQNPEDHHPHNWECQARWSGL